MPCWLFERHVIQMSERMASGGHAGDPLHFVLASLPGLGSQDFSVSLRSSPDCTLSLFPDSPP